MADRKVAIITGGTSGIGLAVANNLLDDDWEVYILYHTRAHIQTTALPRAHLREADVASWKSLSEAFKDIFHQSGRLDFVFANAGVLPKAEFFENMTGNSIMPIDTLSIAVNLQGVMQTCQLACHYFSRSCHRGQGASLLINSSSAALYPQGFMPIYGASKAGVLHFMRSIARPLFRSHGIRVHAICPGPVYTKLASKETWSAFPVDCFVPMKAIVMVARCLIDDGPFNDSAGNQVASESKFGLAVEVGTSGFYLRDVQAFSDATAQSSLALLSTLDKTSAK
ncbi:NAD(P)-binding protein [Biscogniauxia mediterranea]|nr:NAD(P)-binding protein [Biscogniauxia mediterranea]